MSARTFAIFMAVLAVLGLLAFGLASKGDEALAVGSEAPVAELPVLGEQDTASVADYRGEWVLVNVWASWCTPCEDEAPVIQRFYERHRGDSFTVVGVDTEDASAEGLAFAAEHGLTYPLLHDGPGDYADQLKTTGVPENILVDPDGEIALVFRGPVSEEYLETEVEPLIRGS